MTSRGHEWRILAIETEIAEELIELGINGVFTVEQFAEG
jgi:anti-anti-sigma regulatory factor